MIYAVGMSGGVDSSVAAKLLLDAGHEVRGINLLLTDGGGAGAERARAVAEKLGIPFSVLDFRREFREAVIEPFCSEYLCGLTPNPCVFCNMRVKFGLMLTHALDTGCDGVATGHYANVSYNDGTGRYELFTADDDSKDQSYFLWGLTQHQLSHTLFPLSQYSKPRIREIALGCGFENHAQKDSQDICFIPDGDHAAFIEKETGGAVPGVFVDTAGLAMGAHKGIHRYTVGQRRGLGVSGGRRLYVVSKRVDGSQIVLGDNSDLYSSFLTARGVNFISIEKLKTPIRAAVKTRYSHNAAGAIIEPLDNDRIKVLFDSPQRAVTAGQSVVFYDGNKVVGGGFIDTFGND